MKYLLGVLFSLLILGCSSYTQPKAETKVEKKEYVTLDTKQIEKDKVKKEVKKEKLKKSKKINSMYDDKHIIGSIELVQVVPVKVTKKARIDTGATTTSIDAQDIVLFERDGKKWVKFKFAGKEIQKKLVDIVSIKRHGADDVKRPSVMIKLALGDVVRNVKVTLADRSKFTYPILIGRNFLRDMFIVDVSKKMGSAPKVKGSK